MHKKIFKSIKTAGDLNADFLLKGVVIKTRKGKLVGLRRKRKINIRR